MVLTELPAFQKHYEGKTLCDEAGLSCDTATLLKNVSNSSTTVEDKAKKENHKRCLSELKTGLCVYIGGGHSSLTINVETVVCRVCS